ncbi:MAG: transposase [Candidatus Moranbacteria bacterium]|nr:transposase [Candidatus Moranbacteria bacterium]
MAYTTNPHVPKVRWEAVKMLRKGKSSREVARYFGYHQSTILRWSKMDIIHLLSPKGERVYVYTMIDLCSRFASAEVSGKIGAKESIRFFRNAQKRTPFPIRMIQSDNGAEFSIGFTHALLRYGTAHRHSRVRRSNDQTHVERFNRTVQEECLDQVSHGLRSFRKALRQYLPYYNEERLHTGN